jgi:hypothetical protein
MTYQPLEDRARAAMLALGAALVAAAAVGISAVVDAELLGQAMADPGSVSASRLKLGNTLADVLYIVAAATYLTAATLLLRWVHLAAANLRVLGDRPPRYTPGWSVGFWLIPIVNVVMAKRVMNDLWRAGRPRDEVPVLLHVWWGSWLVAFGLSNVADRAAADSGHLADIQRQDQLDVAASVAVIAAGILAILVVREITRRQTARAAAVGPPPEPAWEEELAG